MLRISGGFSPVGIRSSYPGEQRPGKRKTMNEFQAITVEVIFFVLRFAIPALIIYASAKLVKHFVGSDSDADETTNVAH